jgi:hypothetical protein
LGREHGALAGQVRCRRSAARVGKMDEGARASQGDGDPPADPAYPRAQQEHTVPRFDEGGLLLPEDKGDTSGRVAKERFPQMQG